VGAAVEDELAFYNLSSTTISHPGSNCRTQANGHLAGPDHDFILKVLTIFPTAINSRCSRRQSKLPIHGESYHPPFTSTAGRIARLGGY
jgi:hypothetical protein